MKDSKWWHVRKNKITNHPALIVDEEKNKYMYSTITHAPKDGHHNNLKLKANPNPKDYKNSYVKKRFLKDKKRLFKEIEREWKLSDEDIEAIKKILRKYK